jgi:putative effector of murein hydrolase LrgA (UPF0299 family)
MLLLYVPASTGMMTSSAVLRTKIALDTYFALSSRKSAGSR